MRTTSPPIQPKPATSSYSRPHSASICMPTQMPRKGRARFLDRLDHRLFQPVEGLQPAPAGGKCAVAGQHDTGRARHLVGVGTHDNGARADLGGHALKRLFRRMQVAGFRKSTRTVVMSLMPCRARLAVTARPWSRGSRRTGAGRAPPPRGARGRRILNAASAMWWLFTPASCVTWSVMPPWVRKRLEELAHELGVERADLGRRERHVPDEERTRRQVERGAHQRLVHHQVARAVAPNAALVAQRLRQRLAQRDADILHRVVVVDMQIARGCDGQVDQSVARQLVEHVGRRCNPTPRAVVVAPVPSRLISTEDVGLPRSCGRWLRGRIGVLLSRRPAYRAGGAAWEERKAGSEVEQVEIGVGYGIQR